MVFRRAAAFAFGLAVVLLATWVPVVGALFAWPYLPELAQDHVVQESPHWRLSILLSAAIVAGAVGRKLRRWGFVTMAWGITAATVVFALLYGAPEVFRAWELHREFGLAPFGL